MQEMKEPKEKKRAMAEKRRGGKERTSEKQHGGNTENVSDISVNSNCGDRLPIDL